MSDAPRIRIISEGSGATTRVYNEDGTEIHGITAVDVSLRPGEPNRATIEVLAVNGEINAEVEAIKERLVPEPSAEVVVKVGEARDATEAFIIPKGARRLVITRITNRGTDHTLVETVCEGWVSACDPFELTVADLANDEGKA